MNRVVPGQRVVTFHPVCKVLANSTQEMDNWMDKVAFSLFATRTPRARRSPLPLRRRSRRACAGFVERNGVPDFEQPNTRPADLWW